MSEQEKLIMDMIEKEGLSPEEFKQFQASISTYKLDRKKLKTIDNILDIFEFLAGEMNLEKGASEEIFLANPISKYYTKVEDEEEKDTDSSMSSLP